MITAPSGITASRIEAEDRTAEGVARDRMAAALIDGCNLFTGDLPQACLINGIIRVCSGLEWEEMWRLTLRQPVPAALPEGLEAIVYFSTRKEDPVHVLPQDVHFDGRALNIRWQRTHMGIEGDASNADIPSRFAALIVPKLGYAHSFCDVDGRARDKLLRVLSEERAIITGGIARDVAVLPLLHGVRRRARPS